MSPPQTAAGSNRLAHVARLSVLRATGSAILPSPRSSPESSILRPSREAAEKVPTVATYSNLLRPRPEEVEASFQADFGFTAWDD